MSDGVTLDIEKMFLEQIAARVLESMPEETRKEILTKAVVSRIDNMRELNYEINKAIQAACSIHVAQIMQEPAIQALIHEKARAQTEVVIDRFLQVMGKEQESWLRQTYPRIFPEQK